MMIPGVYMALITFPGVVVHEFAHQLFCRLCGVAIFDVKYFQMADPVGYVQHEPVKKPIHQLLISVGPFIVNNILALALAFPASIPVFMFNDGSPFDFLLLYLGLSIAMHAFPSTTDAKVMWEAIWHGKDTPRWLKIITVPITGLIYAGAMGSVIWLDLVYGMGIAFGLPILIIKFFAQVM